MNSSGDAHGEFILKCRSSRCEDVTGIRESACCAAGRTGLVIAGIDAAGKTIPTSTITRVYDGMPHPVPGSADYDTEAATRVDANTVVVSRMKAGKFVQANIMTVSADAKTRTFTAVGVDASGKPLNSVTVFDKP
jgi:hypothetical protein